MLAMLRSMRILRELWVGGKLLIAAAAMALLVAGCEDRGTNTGHGTSGPRIVSFSPALTQMVVDLGARDQIVGVGRFDPLAGSGPAIVGDLNQYDYEKLLSLDPTVILLQPPGSGVPKKLRDMAGDEGWLLRTFKIETVADAKRALYDPRGRSVGQAIGRPGRASALRDRIEMQLARINLLTLEDPVEDVLLVVGVGSTVTAAGPNTFLGELLTFAGGGNALSEDASDYPKLGREKLLSMDPNFVVIAHTEPSSPPGQPPDLIAELDITAVQQGQVHWLTDKQALLPSTTMPRVAGKLAIILHPDLRSEIEMILAGESTAQDAAAGRR